jgi:hypothetical protein
MTFLTKSDLLKKAVRRYLDFQITINGESRTCRIQSLTEKERSDYEASMQLAKNNAIKSQRMKDAKRRLIVLCVVDENGNTILTMADVKELENVDSQITSIIFNKCIEHVGFTDDDVEELAGNSEGIDAA